MLRAALLFLHFLPSLRFNSCLVSFLFNPRDKQLGWSVTGTYSNEHGFSHSNYQKKKKALSQVLHCRQAFSDVLMRFQSTCILFGIIIKSNMYVSCHKGQKLIGSSFGDLEYMDGAFLQAELMNYL